MDTNELRKAAKAVFIVLEDSVARDLSAKLSGAADEIDSLRARLRAAELDKKPRVAFTGYGPMH